MKRETPSIYNKLIDVKCNLEKHYRDMQDIEFTVENNELYILQTRRGKRTPPADVKIAVSMVKEGLINQREAICRINANQMDFFLHPMIGRLILIIILMIILILILNYI
jgi:pyruvate,orthophosphate dikinase